MGEVKVTELSVEEINAATVLLALLSVTMHANPNFHDYDKDAETLARALREARASAGPEWVATSERHPSSDVPVLFVARGYLCFGPLRSTEWVDFASYSNGDHDRYGLDEATHWMPLPALPKGLADV